jgi:hypothetical protein
MTPSDSLSSTPDDRGSAQAALNLRPLSLGEVLDRAFHIYFKNIAAFSAIVAVVFVPSLLISYFESRGLLDFYLNMAQQVIQNPNTTPDMSRLNSMMPSDTWVLIQYALLFLGFPFAYGAVVAAVSKAYLGLPISFKESYQYALRRWLSILILIFVWVVAIIVSTFALIIVLAIFFAITIPGLAALGKASVFFGILFGILMIAGMLASGGIIIMLYLTAAVSFIAVVIENVDPLQAFGSAFSRIFGGHQFWRGFVLALALLGIDLGASVVGAGGGALLAYVFKSPALYLILAGMTSLFFGPFALVAAAVFYYDIRIRREGYDLQMLAERFAPSATPATPSGS